MPEWAGKKKPIIVISTWMLTEDQYYLEYYFSYQVTDVFIHVLIFLGCRVEQPWAENSVGDLQWDDVGLHWCRAKMVLSENLRQVKAFRQGSCHSEQHIASSTIQLWREISTRTLQTLFHNLISLRVMGIATTIDQFWKIESFVELKM